MKLEIKVEGSTLTIDPNKVLSSGARIWALPSFSPKNAGSQSADEQSYIYHSKGFFLAGMVVLVLLSKVLLYLSICV